MPDQEENPVLTHEQVAESLIADLKKKLSDAEVLRASLEELTTAAQTKLSEINLAATAAGTCQ